MSNYKQYDFYYNDLPLSLKHNSTDLRKWRLTIQVPRAVHNPDPQVPAFKFLSSVDWIKYTQTISVKNQVNLMTATRKEELGITEEMKHSELLKVLKLTNASKTKPVWYKIDDGRWAPGYTGYNINQNSHNVRILPSKESKSEYNARRTAPRTLEFNSAIHSLLEAYRHHAPGYVYVLLRNLCTEHYEPTDQKISYILMGFFRDKPLNAVLLHYLFHYFGAWIENFRSSLVHNMIDSLFGYNFITNRINYRISITNLALTVLDPCAAWFAYQNGD